MASAFIPSLKSKIKTTYETGTRAGDILFTPSDVHILTDNGIDFELRCAEGLKRKPKPTPEEKAKDPFSPPYAPNSLVLEHKDEVSGEEFVVLARLMNKFPVQERHFMLCTKEYAPQTMPPSPAELYTTLRILQQFDSTAEGIPKEPHLAFFNCGDRSGASQPHKHLQFVPLRLGEAPIDGHIERCKPADLKPTGWFSLPEDTLPPANFIVDLSHASKLAQTDAGAAQDMLGTLLATLLDASFDNLRHVSAQRPDAPPDEVPTKMGQMHYNLVITTRYLMLVPRQEGDYVLDGEQGQIPLNALCWAGMLMTKEEKHVGLLQMLGIHTLLEHVGFPRAALQSGQEVQ